MDPAEALLPGVATLSLAHVSGPLGKGIWNRLIDLSVVSLNRTLLQILEWYTNGMRGTLYPLAKNSWEGKISIGTLFNWLGRDRLSRFVRILLPNVKSTGLAIRRLAYFTDGAGK